MNKITDNDNWNVYWEHCGMTSKEYFVMQDTMYEDISFVNDEDKAMRVCEALNKANVIYFSIVGNV